MASSVIKYALAPPEYSDISLVYSHTGVVTEDITIEDDGWYTFSIKGYWDQSSVNVFGNNSKVILQAQITTSNVFIVNGAVLPIKAGTKLRVRIGNAGGSVQIYKIT